MSTTTQEKTANKPKIMTLKKSEAKKLVLLRVLIIIIVDIVVCVCFNHLIHSPAEVEYTFYTQVRPVLFWLFIALTVAAVVYLIITLVKKIDTSAHVLTPAMICAISVYLAILTNSFFYTRFRQSPYLFYTLTIIASVLFVVYYVYTVLLYKK
jgi:hypothetical protein